MASTTVIDPAAAGSAASAASSGASSSNGGAGGGGGAQTDDAILGITAEDVSASTGSDSAAAGQATGSPAAPSAAAPQSQSAAPATTQELQDITLEEIKGAFTNNPLGPKLQRLYDQHAAVKQGFGTIGEARKAASAVQQIGGVAKLEEFIASAVDVNRENAVMLSGTPQERKGLAGEYYQQSPDALVGMTRASVDFLREKDPARFAEFTSGVATDFLKTNNFPKFLAYAKQAIDANDADAISDVVAKMVAWGSSKGLLEEGGALATERAKLNSDRAAFEAKQNETQQETFTRLQTEADQRTDFAVKGEIEKTLDGFKLADGRKVSMPAWTRDVVIQRIQQEVWKNAQANPVLRAQVLSLAQTARTNPQAWQEMERASLAMQQRLLPAAFEKVMTEVTGHLVSSAQGAAEKAKGAATRVDVGTGSSNGRGAAAGKLTPADVRTGGRHAALSDEEILGL